MVLKLLPLQGDRLPPKTTQGVALGYELLPFQGVLLIGALPFQGVLLIGALPFQGALLIGAFGPFAHT